MVTPTCSKCGRAIPGEDVNVANDVAYCRACNVSYKLSALTDGTELDASVDVHNPPAGAWYQSSGMGTVIGATHRSIGSAIGALLVALFWNGIVSVFVLVATAGTLSNLHVTVPAWFPAPNMNHSPMGVGMTIFLWLFLTPFITIGIIMVCAFLSSLGGRTEVRILNAQGTVFSGIGPFGWNRRFDASTVKDVRVENPLLSLSANPNWRITTTNNTQRKTYIALELRDGKLIRFGSMLREDRKKFVAAAARQALVR